MEFLFCLILLLFLSYYFEYQFIKKTIRDELKNWLKQIQAFHIEQRGLVDNKFDYLLESEVIDVLEDVLHKMQEFD